MGVDNNDDRPIELPISKRPVWKTRYENSSNGHNSRDPRFDTRCGEFKQELFAKNYQFINDLQQQELDTLKKALKKTKDGQKKHEIQAAMVKIKNKLMAKKEAEKKQTVIKKLSAKKRHVKKSDIKKSLLVDKFKELKETGKLTRYMERKRKKLINKDKRGFV